MGIARSKSTSAGRLIIAVGLGWHLRCLLMVQRDLTEQRYVLTVRIVHHETITKVGIRRIKKPPQIGEEKTGSWVQSRQPVRVPLGRS